MLFGLWTWVGPGKQYFIGGADPHANGQFLGLKTRPGMRDDILPQAVQKMLH